MGNRGKKGNGQQGTCIKDTRTKPKGVRIKGVSWGWLGREKVVVGKWRQLYLNNKIIIIIIIIMIINKTKKISSVQWVGTLSHTPNGHGFDFD